MGVDLQNTGANPDAKFPQVFYFHRCSVPTGAPFPKVAHLGLGLGLGAGATLRYPLLFCLKNEGLQTSKFSEVLK